MSASSSVESIDSFTQQQAPMSSRQLNRSIKRLRVDDAPPEPCNPSLAKYVKIDKRAQKCGRRFAKIDVVVLQHLLNESGMTYPEAEIQAYRYIDTPQPDNNDDYVDNRLVVKEFNRIRTAYRFQMSKHQVADSVDVRFDFIGDSKSLSFTGAHDHTLFLMIAGFKFQPVELTSLWILRLAMIDKNVYELDRPRIQIDCNGQRPVWRSFLVMKSQRYGDKVSGDPDRLVRNQFCLTHREIAEMKDTQECRRIQARVNQRKETNGLGQSSDINSCFYSPPRQHW